MGHQANDQPNPLIPGTALHSLISALLPIWISGLGNRCSCTTWLYHLGECNGVTFQIRHGEEGKLEHEVIECEVPVSRLSKWFCFLIHFFIYSLIHSSSLQQCALNTDSMSSPAEKHPIPSPCLDCGQATYRFLN